MKSIRGIGISMYLEFPGLPFELRADLRLRPEQKEITYVLHSRKKILTLHNKFNLNNSIQYS